MEKNSKSTQIWSIAAGALVLLGGVTYFISNRSEPVEPVPELKATDDAVYSFDFRTMQADEEDKRNLVIYSADLKNYRQGSDWVSEWTNVESFTLNDQVVNPQDLGFVGKSTVSSYNEAGISHAVSPDFPKIHMGFQVSMLNKFYLPFALTEAKEFTRKEIEDIATYDVKYDVRKTSTGFSVIRTWKAEQGDNIAMDDEKNNILYTFDASGRLLRANGTLIYRPTGNSNLVYRTDVLIKLKKAETQVADRKPVDSTQYKQYDVKSAMAEAQAADPSRHIPSLEEIYQNIDTFNEKTSAQDRFYLYSDLSNDLERNPENLPKLVNKILEITERDESSQRRASVLFSVLAGNSSQESAVALAKLAHDSCPDDFCRSQAVMAHGMHRNPTVDSAKDILKVAQSSDNEDVAGNAYLSVGNSGQVLGEKFSDLTPTLINDFNATENPAMKMMIIKGMGNHGQKEYFPLIKDSIATEDHVARTSAIFALRNVPEETVTPTLMAVIEQEESDIVREKALKALSYRPVAKEEYEKIAEIGLRGDETDELTVARFMAAAYRDHHSASAEVVQSMLGRLKSSDAKSFLETATAEVDKQIEIERSLLEDE